MTYPKTKKEITELVLKELPHLHWQEIPIDQVIYRWWMTGRGGYGLRLTDEGAGSFKEANLAYYEFPLGLTKDKNTKKPEHYVQELSKKIQCPYYIGVDKEKKTPPYIRIYDHRIATILTLYGNLREYLDSFDERIK